MGASVKRRLTEKALMPIVAAGTSAAVGYVVKRAPGFVEEKVRPKVREAAQARGDDGGGESSGDATVSQDELSRRSEERARHRAERRKTTTSK